MFHGTIFNQPLNNWNVSNVKDMGFLFWCNEKFNQPLNNWDVSNVTSMEFMFSSAKNFNQNIDNWNISNVQNMRCMFTGVYAMKKYNNRPKWKISQINDTHRLFDDSRWI